MSAASPARSTWTSEAALGLLEHLRAEGFDPAQSLKMTVDHGFSQTMKNVMGALDAWPCVPVFISAMTTPFLPFRRSRDPARQLLGRCRCVPLGERTLNAQHVLGTSRRYGNSD